MKNRKQRVALSIKLIREGRVSSQKELSDLLEKEGFKITQACLSRDLRIMKARRVKKDGKPIYVLPDGFDISQIISGEPPVPSYSYETRVGFVSFILSGNLAVVKTRRNYTTTIAREIEYFKLSEVLGVIAGHDTIFCVLREDVTHGQAFKAFSRVLPLSKPRRK